MNNALVSLLGTYSLIIVVVFVFQLLEQTSMQRAEEVAGVQYQKILQNSFVNTQNEEKFNLAILKASDQEVVIEDIEVGVGSEAQPGDIVSVHYTGKFASGEVFDSSLRPGRDTFEFELGAGQVIEGWEEALVGMREGGVRRVIVPPHLGYGFDDYGPIPGGSTLIFEIELLSVYEN